MAIAIEPVSPIAPYIGGKRNLSRRLVRQIDGVEHQTYVEPFVGMGGVFFRRRLRPRVEIVNDASRDVANLFRILQRHYPQFIEFLRFQVTSRAEFERLSRADPATLTDLERAGRFLYLQRLGFGGKVVGRSFGVSRDRPARFNLTTLEPMLQDVHERLAGVVIECLNYDEAIRRYDSPTTLFYLDPPYWGSEGDYGKGQFDRDDFARLEAALSAIEGRFIMSLNSTPETRTLSGGFHIEKVEVAYTVSAGRATRAGELIIRNWS